MRIFLLEHQNNRSIDLSSLEEMGDIHLIFDHNVRRPSIFSPDLYMSEVIVRLNAFNVNEDDVFVLAGAHAPCALATAAVFMHCEFNTLKLAMWDSTQERYVIKTTNLETVEHHIGD